MTDNLENLAIEELAITNPTAYINSNPSPREWTMTPQDIARSLKLTAEDFKNLSVQKTKDSALTTLGKGIGSGITGGIRSIMRTADISSLQSTYSSPNMTRDEADRLLQDAEYTAHFLRKKEMAETAEDIKHEWAYDLGNAVGSMIQFVGLGLATGSTAAIGLAAGVQAKSTLEEGLVDTFIEKTGGIEGYTEEQKSKESALATAYGVFTGITEQILGVEKLATGAINGLTKANALSRLARMQGKLGKSALIKYGSRLGQAAIGEGAEEFIQSLGEDAAVALAGYADTLTKDEVLKKAFVSAGYGALVGGPVGMGLYRYNRKSIIDRINKWSEEKELGLTEQQIVNMADEMLDINRSTIVDEVATRAEIKNQYGQAYETLKARIGEQIDATGTTPWTDQNKSREEYINAVAMTVTLPAVVQANRAGLPLSEFLDTANIQVINNVLYFEPVADINQLQTILDQQNDIIAEQNRLAKLNNDDPAAKQNAQRRKAILENAIRGMQMKNGIQTAARTRRKAQADYITAQQLAPEQMGTIDTAVEAQEGQEYVLFGGKKIPVEYQVVELADLQPSHINGTVNPNYSNKELQNRASRGTVQDVADLREKGANITPERLLRGMTSAEGAPITNAQNEVIAGNGRTEIIRVAYENPETAARYRSALEKAGFSTEGMNQPVLIRKNTTMTTAEQVAAADISNISETSAFDEASQAKRDTQFLKDSETPLDFAAKLPMSERRGLMLNNGKWNMRKVQQRYEDALLSWICGNDTQLFEELVLNRGLTQKVIDVLTSNGATIYNLQETYPDTEIRQDIYNALVKMQRATRDNFLDMTQTIELDGHDPMIENTLVWGFLYTNRSGNNLILKNYATTLQENHQAVNNGADMFGNTVAPLSKKDAMIQALQAADEASAQMAADRGREYEGLFTETGEIKNPELAAAVASYQNQFAAQGENTLFKIAYSSGSTYFDRPSTAFVLVGGEGAIVHGWGVYAQKDRQLNIERYRNRFKRYDVFVRNMPEQGGYFQETITDKNGVQFPIFNKNLTDEENIQLTQLSTMLGLTNIANNGSKKAVNALSALTNSLSILTPLGPAKDQLKADLEIYGAIKDEDTPVKGLSTKIKKATPFLKDVVDTIISGFGIPVKEITGDLLTKGLEISIEDADVSRFLDLETLLKNIAPGNSEAFYVEMKGYIENALQGIDPMQTVLKVDNTKFKDANATVLDFEKNRRAEITLEYLKNTVRDEYMRSLPVHETVQKNEEYGGFIGLYALAKNLPWEDANNALYSFTIDGTNLGNIDEVAEYQTLKSRDSLKANKFFLSIIDSAKELYNSQEMQAQYPEEDKRTWASLSKAFRTMTKKQENNLIDIIDTTFELKPSKVGLFIEVLKEPHKIKRTRGQQLQLDIPESNELLNENDTLAEQPSQRKIRAVLDEFVPYGLGFDFIENTDDGNFEEFRKKHKIKEEDLDAFYRRASNQQKNSKEITKDMSRLIDYIMENMTGEGLYLSLISAVPQTYIKLKSGEEIGDVKEYDGPTKGVLGVKVDPEIARDVSLLLNERGIKGIQYLGGVDKESYVVFSDESIEVLQRMDDNAPIYYQKGRGKPMGWYDPELQAIVLGKTWNETTIVHEFHHRYLEKIWGIYKQAQAGQKVVNQAWIEETEKLFEMLGIDPSQDEISVEQQEQFASMVEAYITGLGVEKPETQAFTDFLNWVPEKYKSILNIGYLDKDGNIKNPVLDEQSVAFFNRWFGNPALPSLPTAPDAQRMANPTDANGEIVPSTQKEMNNREKEWGQDSEEQNKADAQLWRAIGENTPTDMRAAVDAEEAVMKEEAKALPDDRVLPEEKKQTLRDRWFKTYQPDARERAAEMARKYVKENPEHARELAFADPEIETEYDAPVDRGMLIRAVMETTAKGSDEWYILDNNLAVVKSMSASTLSLSGDISHRAYLDAKREVENARELKAAVNYAGTTRGAMDKWNSDIRDFISKRVGKIIATEADSEERKLAIKAFIEEAKTKFSGNTTNAILNQLDLTGYKTKSQQAFIKWAEKQIKQAAHAHIDAKEQAELMKASIKAQLAMTEIDSAQQDVNGNFARATAAAKDLRHWQFVKDKMKKAYIGKWGRWGIFWDNLFNSYTPSAMLMSINTLLVANIPSTAINNSIVKSSAQAIYGKNAVDKTVLENEKKRIRQIFNASGMNLAQMEKPTSPSVLHGEKYMNTEQEKWYNFTFKILGRGDNLFRIPTFVDTLARIASKNANGDSAKATKLFREYAQINNASDEAKIARKQALAVANMGVFTQEGILASNLNHIRSSINSIVKGLTGIGGFGNLLAPFVKTGANVVEMGIRGSIAPVQQISAWAKQMQGKEITDLDKIALRVDWKYFTYTAVAMALFAAISNDDDKWYEEPYQTGRTYDPNKPYDSIKIGNAWVKLDIFGPFAIPIRAAAKIIQRWEDGALTAIANGYGFGANEALSDLPLANQITDNSLSYMAKQPGKWATGFLYNQANKLVPAQLKSIARAGSRATDTELDVSGLGRTIERKFHRNYGFDGEELTTNDIINLFTNRLKWGEE